jgi:hypothetical protein
VTSARREGWEEQATATTPATSMRAERHLLNRRLGPLYAAVFFQNLALWVPIEKLFMTTIGFNAASVGVMASVYALVVPVLEVPSGCWRIGGVDVAC